MIRKHEWDQTLVDLIIGILLYGIAALVLGLLIAPGKLSYLLGMLLGIATAVVLAIDMYRCLFKALDMFEKDASRYMVGRSLLRALVMLVVVGVGMYLEQVNFVAVFIGILGLKVSAFLQPYTSRYITKK